MLNGLINIFQTFLMAKFVPGDRCAIHRAAQQMEFFHKSPFSRVRKIQLMICTKEGAAWAYVFTNPDVTRALIVAKQRGVDVAVVADHRSNLQEQRTSAARHALTLLAKAGIPTRTVDAYAIHHDEGDLKVAKGDVNYEWKAISPNAFVITWKEADGATVVHIDDFAAETSLSFYTTHTLDLYRL